MSKQLDRDAVASSDKWNLSKLFADGAAFEQTFAEFQQEIPQIATYQNTLGQSASQLKKALDFKMKLEQTLERLGSYAMLRLQEDLSNSAMMSNYIRLQSLYTQYASLSSFFVVELQQIDAATMAEFLKDPLLEEYQIYLNRILRNKEHTLGLKEENLLAPLSELFEGADSAFSALVDADMEFGEIDTSEGKKPLTQASYVTFLKSRDRETRKNAYFRYYGIYGQYKNTIGSLYGTSVRQDIYTAKVRGFKSAREVSLFQDNVSADVYDNLVSTVRSGFPILHRYYALRKELLKVDDLRHYDVYAPLVGQTTRKPIPYDEGVELICEALKPLGSDYVATMRNGLLNGWVDRYENKGKSSGAFSAGSYSAEPYILMNYKPTDIRSLFTLAHEAGHSMHSFYSVKNNPFQHYDYSIFEAEVASTFNEALLFDYLLKNSTDEELKHQLIGERIDDISSTLFRQTMFAEYEYLVHKQVEQGAAASLDLFLATYDQLLKDYFGPTLQFEDFSKLECLRIPHFYRAFYVYKYATGISASLALSQRVLKGGPSELADYLSFLKSGGSKFPIESLKLAGVDMATKAPVEAALASFEQLLNQFS